ncbi:MAG: ABC transporter permease [Saccharofermentans sp.]|nr:ABC transporter permease [Saccharofermentans sp.]
MLKAFFKRALNFMPYVAVYFLVLCLMAGGIIAYARNVFYKDGTFAIVNVACYYIENSENSYGLQFVENMESFEQSVHLIDCDNPEEVLELVEDGEVVAGLIFPDGFVDSIMTGENLSVDVIYNESATFEGYVVSDLLSSLTSMLGVGQASMQSMYDFCKEYDLDTSAVDVAQIRSLSYAMSRFDLFEETQADSISDYSLVQKTTAAYSIYILLLSGFVFAYFYKGNTSAFIARAKLAGISKFKLFVLENGMVTCMLYVPTLVIIVGLMISPLEVSPLALIAVLPVVLMIATVISGVCYVVKNSVASGYVIFAVGTLLMYLAGGLMPLEFMPRFLQELAIYNPCYYLIGFMLKVMFI